MKLLNEKYVYGEGWVESSQRERESERWGAIEVAKREDIRVKITKMPMPG